MNIEKITDLHAQLLSDIEISELSDKNLLRYGGMLLKHFRQAKAVLRKIKIDEINKTQHWILVREHCNEQIDLVLLELQDRMNLDPEAFAEGMLLNFADLVGSIRVAIFDEELLDNKEEDLCSSTEDIQLIFDEEDE